MQIPITGMKHIGHGQTMQLGQPVDFEQHIGQTRARNHGVHHNHVGTHAAHRAKCSLTAEPQLRALLVVLCHSNFVGLIPAADVGNRSRHFFDAVLKSIQFDQQRGACIERIAGLEYRCFHGVNGLVIDELQTLPERFPHQ